MRLASLARRSVAITAAAALLSTGGVATGLLTGVATAAPQPVAATPSASNNSGSPLITISGSGFNPATNTVVLRPLFTGTEVADIKAPIQGPETAAAGNPQALLVVKPTLDLAPPGDYDIVVTESGAPGAVVASCGSVCFTVTQGTQPSVTGSVRDPGSLPPAGRGDSFLIISGKNFARGGNVQFINPDGSVDPAITFAPGGITSAGQASTGYISATQIKGKYIAGPGFIPGQHFLRVTNTDGQTGSTSEFWQPNMVSANPAVIGQGGSTTLTLFGAGFRPKSAIIIPDFGTTTNDVTVGPTTVAADGSSISALVSFGSAAATGARNVTVRSPDGAFQTKAGFITVGTRPSVTGISVPALGRGGTNVPATITGSNFQPGVTFSLGGGGATVSLVSPASPSSASVLLSAASDAQLGGRSVTATNPDFGTGSLTASDTPNQQPPITITAAPTATAVNPASSTRGVTKNIIVSGTGFTAPMTVAFSGSGVTVNGTPAVSKGTAGAPDSVAINVTTAFDAPAGPRDIILTNSGDKGTSTCPSCFGVDTLTLSPSGSANNAPRAITFTSSGGTFGSDAIATLQRFGAPAYQPTLTATNFTPAAGNTSGTGTVDFTDAAPGKYNASVFSGGQTFSCTACFTVTGTAPTVTSITPKSGGQGAVDLPIDVKGTGFSRGESITIGSFVVKGVQFVSPTEITALLSIPAAATTGAYDVVVTNADGAFKGTLTGGFTVNYGPKVTTVSPDNLGQGASAQTVTLTGPGYVAPTSSAPGSVVSFGPAIKVLTTTVTDNPSTPTNATPDDKIVVTVDVAPDAAAGPLDVVVTNPDGGRGVRPAGFTVNLGPKPTSISPAFLKPGDTGAVTITGANFADDSVPAIADVTFANVVKADDGSLTADATVDPAAVGGRRDLTITNPTDNGFGTCDKCFTVATVPDPPTGVTVVQGDSSATVSWTAPAKDGGSPLTGYTVDAGQGVSKVSVAADKTSATVTGLTPGKTYTFTVVAQNALGDSKPATASGTAAGAPTAPTSVVGTPGDGRAVVSFTGATPNGKPITSYTIRTSSTSVPDVTVAAPASSGVVSGLTNGTAYTFTVAATNASGTSSFSAPSAAVVPKFATTLTSTARPSRITAGSRATVSGILRRSSGAAIAGASLVLTFTPDIGASVTRTTTTRIDGTWSYVFAPQYNTTVRARFNGRSDEAAVNAAGFREAVAPRVVVSSPASGSSSSAGSTLSVRGGIAPNKAGRTVGLYKVVNGSLRLVGHATVAGNGSYAINVRLPRGSYRLVVGIGATRGNVAGYSAAIGVSRR